MNRDQLHSERIAVLYQAGAAPPVDGVMKPLKPGGYSDSGADIAYVLRAAGVDVLTPKRNADAAEALDWVWKDTESGISAAVNQGATTLWANTVLFEGHPIERFFPRVRVVGQHPANVQRFDDKFATNRFLLSRGLPVNPSFAITEEAKADVGEIAFRDLQYNRIRDLGFTFPLVIKPIRGRGSQGVSVVWDLPALENAAQALLSARSASDNLPMYGSRLLVEEYLPGEELTITVMPPGTYLLANREESKQEHWALPPVRRRSHQNGIAPYNGTVAVTENSTVLSSEEWKSSQIQTTLNACCQAAGWVRAFSPIRIDCRMDRTGEYKLFDLNMKPNMTGPGRPNRENQDSLSALAARAIGWDFEAFLLNMLFQAW